MAEYFKGFSLADHTLLTRPEPEWQKMAKSPLNDTSHKLWTSRRNALAEVKKLRAVIPLT